MFSQKTLRVARYVGVAAVTALTFGVSAHAADAIAAAGPAKATINYSDLDLSKDADVHALYSRLQRASSRVCGDYTDLRNLRMRRQFDACYQDTLARAVDSVGHASVKAVFASDERIHMAGRNGKAQSST